MAERRHYLKEWRRYRDLRQDDVVDRLAAFEDPLLPATGASLSRLENGKQIYNERILAALADIYQTEPENLIGHNPFKEGRIIDFVAKLDEKQREQAIAVIEALARAGGAT